jgi:hypothetical protein
VPWPLIHGEGFATRDERLNASDTIKPAGGEMSSTSYGRAVAAAPGHGFKSHQPDSRLAVGWTVLSAVSPLQQTFMYSAEDSGRYIACGDLVSSTADQRKVFGTNASTP